MQKNMYKANPNNHPTKHVINSKRGGFVPLCNDAALSRLASLKFPFLTSSSTFWVL
jgi:hypothetical protein